MKTETLLKFWYEVLREVCPLEDGEIHTFEDFSSSPIVKSLLTTLKIIGVDDRLDLILLETNMQSILAMGGAGVMQKSIANEAIRKIHAMRERRLELYDEPKEGV